MRTFFSLEFSHFRRAFERIGICLPNGHKIFDTRHRCHNCRNLFTSFLRHVPFSSFAFCFLRLFNINNPHNTHQNEGTRYPKPVTQALYIWAWGGKKICLFISSSEINLHNLHWNGMIARMSLFSRLFCILSSIPCAHLFVACFISFYVWALWKKKQPNFVSFAICLRFIYLRFTQQTYHFANVCQPQ